MHPKNKRFIHVSMKIDMFIVLLKLQYGGNSGKQNISEHSSVSQKYVDRSLVLDTFVQVL